MLQSQIIIIIRHSEEASSKNKSETDCPRKIGNKNFIWVNQIYQKVYIVLSSSNKKNILTYDGYYRYENDEAY